ncbi:lytic transglycosylase domain-containing protein [Dethiothermospora halolimnae]|uniref:lytic transglycosylase domain-containing protein n=1 Tax=Dethiothermospora halolimnae TaxID=3114390 RepID=UPI003CCC13EE
MKRIKINFKRLSLNLIFIICITIVFAVFINEKEYKKENFEIKYENYVNKHAEKYNVDKYLVYAMMKQESHFNKDAVSVDEARGLMQITEDTFNWLKFRLGDKDTTFDDMFDPDTNIKYAIYFISLLQERFPHRKTITAAYNAGMNITSKWLKDSKYSKDGVTLHYIPYKETEKHVEIVENNYKKYKELYDL